MHFLLLSLFFALVVAALAVQNAQPVTVSFFAYHLETSLVVVIIGSALVGAMALLSLIGWTHFKLRRKIRKLESRNLELETKLFQRVQDITQPLPAVHFEPDRRPRIK